MKNFCWLAELIWQLFHVKIEERKKVKQTILPDKFSKNEQTSTFEGGFPQEKSEPTFKFTFEKLFYKFAKPGQNLV